MNPAAVAVAILLSLAATRGEPLAVLDAACTPVILSRARERQMLHCFAQLDQRPPSGASCTWEWNGVGYRETRYCKGTLEQARHEYRPSLLVADATDVRFAVFSVSGALLTDRTIVVEVGP